MMQGKKIIFTLFSTLTFLASYLHAAGEVKEGTLSTYLVGALQEASAVQSALKGAGFEVLAEHQIDKAGDLTTIVFTSAKLKSMANKKGKGFASILRVLVNKADHEIAITNPLYFERAFLQDAYDDAGAHEVLAQLNTAFANLADSKDSMNVDDLAGYHFMMGMPYYEDMATVGEGADLVAKARANTGGKQHIFSLPLDNGSTLIGYKIQSDTAKFVKKIGAKNAALLPYTILVENNKAKILAPKYYLALSYPSLSMSQFMTIATVPGAIEKDCQKGLK